MPQYLVRKGFMKNARTMIHRESFSENVPCVLILLTLFSVILYNFNFLEDLGGFD